MSAFGQKRTFALNRPCPLYPRKRTCAAQAQFSSRRRRCFSFRFRHRDRRNRIGVPTGNAEISHLLAQPVSLAAAFDWLRIGNRIVVVRKIAGQMLKGRGVEAVSLRAEAGELCNLYPWTIF